MTDLIYWVALFWAIPTIINQAPVAGVSDSEQGATTIKRSNQ